MVLSIEAFEEKFKDDIRPYWKAFAGRGTKVVIGTNTELENIEESWTKLSTSLGRYDSGTFKVLTFSNPSATNGTGWESVIKIGAGVSGVNSQRQPQGMGNMQIFQMMQHFDAQAERRERAAVAAAQAAADIRMNFMKEMLELKNDNAALAGALEDGNGSAKEQLVTELISSVSPLVEAFTDWMKLGFVRPVDTTAQLGTMGQKEIEQPVVAKETAKPKQKGVSFDRLAMAAKRIQKAIPEHHVNDLMDLVAGFAEQSPDQVKALVNQLKGN